MNEKLKGPPATEAPKKMNGTNGGTARAVDLSFKILGSLVVIFCAWLFSYVLKLEAKMVSFDSYVAHDIEFHQEHRDLHKELNVDLSKIASSLNQIVTDVRVIQGNRFTSRDAQQMQSELTAIQQEITRLWQEMKKVSAEVNDVKIKLNGMK